ncbi:HK97 family phage prohead protease [Kitasatospora sp. CB01950]|uniref:HK97 family phage prohead protease n=1 Tax=Kitasatospora sp. CB01950 TaxID=1703930 RepID=UPI00093F1B55|nr:HK97 family phage prohead protease [Kitasatospora sp. CB01950]
MAELELRQLDTVEWRVADGEDGTFEGVGCRYGVEDSYGTTFHPKVFQKGLRGSFAFLFMHDPSRPVGTFRAEERSDHLWISGQYDDTAAGRDARTMARSGSAPELSVGFVRTDLPSWEALAALPEDEYKDRLANIRSARLVEVSQITARMAAVPGSKLKTVRAALDALFEDGEPNNLDAQVAAERARLAGQEDDRRRAAARLALAAAGH